MGPKTVPVPSSFILISYKVMSFAEDMTNYLFNALLFPGYNSTFQKDLDSDQWFPNSVYALFFYLQGS